MPSRKPAKKRKKKPPPRPRPLTPTEERFVEEYAVDLNGTAAYRRSHPDCTYGTARTESSRLLAKPNIVLAVTAARADLKRRSKATSARVRRELAWIAHADIGDHFEFHADGRITLRPGHGIPPEARRVIKAVKVRRVVERAAPNPDGTLPTSAFLPAEVVEIVLHDKLAALDKLNRMLGLYADPPAAGEGGNDDGPPAAGLDVLGRLAALVAASGPVPDPPGGGPGPDPGG